MRPAPPPGGAVSARVPHGTICFGDGVCLRQQLFAETEGMGKRGILKQAISGAHPWLVPQKAIVPDTFAGYVDRPSLVRQSDLMRWSLTAIQAPAGFGKTTLLAAACRRRRENGDVVAWLTLDEGDNDPEILTTYIDFALTAAGMGSESNLRQDRSRGSHISMLVDRIDAHRSPCALALDNIHHVNSPESIAIINHLLRHRPPNLHLALSYREVPAGVDMAMPFLEGRGVTITAAELRFEKRDIARFFEDSLTRSELATVADTTQGWPIALCISRNVKTQDGTEHTARQLTTNWIEARLWRDVAPDDRDFILDIGLFDWLETDIVDQVLGVGSMRRLKMTPMLGGLTHPVGADDNVLSLHPIVRRYCADRQRRFAPERFRSIHSAIAKALARNGKIIEAMRHATEARDPRLIGTILDDAGATRYWLRNGPTARDAANELATPEVRAMFPRVALMHCAILFLSGELEAGLKAYAELHARTEGLTRDRHGGNDKELHIDQFVFEYITAWVGCQRIGTAEMDALMSRVARIAQDRDIEPFVDAMVNYALGTFDGARGNLDAGIRRLGRARQEFTSSSPYMTMYVDLQLSVLWMCRGRVAESTAALRRARDAIAESDYPYDAGASLVREVLTAELESERTGFAVRDTGVPFTMAKFSGNGAALYGLSAVAQLAADLAFSDGGAAKTLEEAARFAERTGRTTLARCLAGQRVSLLVATGRTGEAQRLWDDSDLPQRLADIVDLDRQTWLEMEAISCAALALRTAQSQFDAAREVADAMLAVCAQRGLRRTQMRGLALAMVAEHRAGNPAAARERLNEYIELYADTDYLRPLRRERDVALEVLRAMDGADIDQRLHNERAALADVLEGHPQRQEDAPVLTPREREILPRLDDWQDKQIAATLNLSVDGVRYHVKNIFHKLGVHDRLGATRRARILGLLPTTSAD